MPHKYLFKFKDTRNFGSLVDYTAIIQAEDPFAAIEIAKENYGKVGEIWRGFSIEIVIDDLSCRHKWKNNKNDSRICVHCSKVTWKEEKHENETPSI